MPRLSVSDAAKADLDSIWDYIAADNPTAATRTVEAIASRFEMIATYQLFGRAREDLAPDLRSFPVGNYVIFYTHGDVFEVVRVLHGARDIEAIFREHNR